MPYDVRIQIGGNVGWLRMAGRRPRPCRCGADSTRLYDWKTGATSRGGRLKAVTCDEPLCDTCTSSPAPDKDLCPTHAAEWLARTGAKA
jgi:hypothetical protein